MRFRIRPLEERIVLDAAVAAAFVASDGGGVEAADAVETVEMVEAAAQFTENVEGAAVDTPLDAPQALLLVSDSTRNYQTLADAASDDVVVVTYDASQTLDSLLSQIETALSGGQASSIAFANHGAADSFALLDGVEITSDTIKTGEIAEFWRRVGEFITDDGRVDLLACNLAQTQDGLLLIQQLEALLDRNVAASTNLTANSDRGGDWILETDGIDAAAIYFDSNALAGWDGAMMDPLLTIDLNALGLIDPVMIVQYRGDVYFFARPDDGSGTIVLVRSDGTQAGTEIAVRNLPGSGPILDASALTVFNDRIYFAAVDQAGVTGSELYRTTGTDATTELVANINPGGFSSFPSNLTVFTDFTNVEKLFFTADDGVGVKLWATDGTTTAQDPSMSRGMVVSDTTFGTDIIGFNSRIYFGADTGNGLELHRTEPVGVASEVVNLNGAGDGLDATDVWLAVLGNELFFVGDNGADGFELFKTNGAIGNFTQVKDINPGHGESSSPSFPERLNNTTLLFGASDGVTGFELWRSDGTAAGTTLVKDIDPAGNSLPQKLTSFDGLVYFEAFTNSATGTSALFSSDGTTAGTIPVDTSPFVLTEISTIANAGSLYFFARHNGGTDWFAWRIEAGTNTSVPVQANKQIPLDADAQDDLSAENYQQQRAQLANARASATVSADSPLSVDGLSVAMSFTFAKGYVPQVNFVDATTVQISYNSLQYNSGQGIPIRGLATVFFPASEIAGSNNPFSIFTARITVAGSYVALNGLDGTLVKGTNITLEGSLADINAALQTLTYHLGGAPTAEAALPLSIYAAAGLGVVEPGSLDLAALDFGVGDLLDPSAIEDIGSSIIVTLTSSVEDTELPSTLTKVVRILFNPQIAFANSEVDYEQGMGPMLIANDAQFSDLDSKTFDGGELVIDYLNLLDQHTGTDFDDLQLEGSLNIRVVSGNMIKIGDQLVASYRGGEDGEALTISFHQNSTPVDVAEVIHRVTYENSSASPATHTRAIRFTVTDADGGTFQEYKYLNIGE